NLDRSRVHRWNARGDLTGFVQVTRFDEIEASELLLGLDERTVRSGQLSVALPQRHRRLNRLQSLAGHIVAASPNLFGELEVRAHEGVRIFLRHRTEFLLVVVD